MSSTAATLSAPRPARGDYSAPSLARLTAVELRKMVDTRAGLWLLLTVGALTLVVVAIVALVGNDSDRALAQMLDVAVAPASVLLPVVGILLVASEFSQRTTLITFALVPRRGRVIAAKALAGVALALVALALCMATAALGTAAASSGVQDAWSLRAGILGQTAISLVTAMLMGIAFGAAILRPAPAIVLYFALPVAIAALGSLAPLEGVAGWLDSSKTLEPLTATLLSAGQWARAGTTLALWLGLPLAIGIWRIQRNEVK